ncbi:hypothetical protein ACFWQL_01340 [Amycolatopsis thermoflava]
MDAVNRLTAQDPAMLWGDDFGWPQETACWPEAACGGGALG